MSNKKISIIVPVYNVEKYLPKCLDSLVNQTYANIEIICVNDGSPDNSLQILEEYARKDERIKIINQQNQGVSVARNVGIDNATGDYILFVDADDWLDTKACEIISEVFKENFDLISFNVIYSDNRKNMFGFEKNASTINNREMWSNCYNKHLLNKYNIRFPEGIKIAEDFVFLSQVLIYTNNIKLIQDYLYYYFIDRRSASSAKDVALQDINAFKFMIMQDWFQRTECGKQAKIIDSWIKLIVDTIIIKPNSASNKGLNKFIESIENLDNYSQYKLKNLKIFKLFITMKKYCLFVLYSKLIRPFGKHCIVLPYRRFKEFLRSRNG